MKKQIITFLILAIIGIHVRTQAQETNTIKYSPQPFLFSLTTLTPEDMKWSMDYSGSYGERVQRPMGFDGVSQQLSVKGYLGKRYTLHANVAVGIAEDNKASSAQQAEVIRNFLGGNKYMGFRIGGGLGARRDFSSDFSVLGRITSEYMVSRWTLGGNALLEKVLAGHHDAIDVLLSMGCHYRFTGNFYGGVEAIGEDLEGFWDKHEAEGGAKLMVGPSLNLMPSESKFSFSVSGGPVILATKNEVTNPDAIRELPSQSGLMIRGKIIFSLD